MVDLLEELRLIGCHENGDARCTCGIGADAADEIDRLRAALAQAEAERERAERKAHRKERLMKVAFSANKHLGAERERDREALAQAKRALKPLHHACFDDNGDVTVTEVALTHRHYVNGHLAHEAISARLAAHKEGETDG